MIFLHPIFASVLFLVLLGLLVYTILYIFFSRRVKQEERAILDIFLHKVSKIPALIEVMKPYVAKSEAFSPLIKVHTDTMIESTESIYDILSHNAQIQNEFLFLMKLSVHTPELQRHEYFVYIRDFIIEYERAMRSRFSRMNDAIKTYNRFVTYKNMTGIGYFLPGSTKAEIQ